MKNNLLTEIQQILEKEDVAKGGFPFPEYLFVTAVWQRYCRRDAANCSIIRAWGDYGKDFLQNRIPLDWTSSKKQRKTGSKTCLPKCKYTLKNKLLLSVPRT